MFIEAAQSTADTGSTVLLVAGITGFTTLIGSWLLFRGQSRQTDAESVVEERKLLASEWGKIRESVDQALDDCRVERDQLQTEIGELRQVLVGQAATIARLETEVNRLTRRSES